MITIALGSSKVMMSCSMRSVCVYGRACAAFSYTINRLPGMSS